MPLYVYTVHAQKCLKTLHSNKQGQYVIYKYGIYILHGGVMQLRNCCPRGLGKSLRAQTSSKGLRLPKWFLKVALQLKISSGPTYGREAKYHKIKI